MYNTLLLHSALVGGSSKKTLLARYYNIGGMKFSLVDIEVGIFRGNRKPVGDGKVFERKDERASLVPSWADPRTLFIVVRAARVSSQVPAGTHPCSSTPPVRARARFRCSRPTPWRRACSELRNSYARKSNSTSTRRPYATRAPTT